MFLILKLFILLLDLLSKGEKWRRKLKKKKKQYIVIAEKWKVFYSSAGVMLVFSALF